MKVYFISGLGADRRTFYRIALPDHFEAIFLDWIQPVPNESLTDYAKRFSKAIDDKNDFIIVGLSLGGILASELGKILEPKKLIIISSLGTNREQPWYFRLAGKMRLHKIISPVLYKRITLINTRWGKGDREMKAIVYNYVRHADPLFMRWALNAVLNWQHTERLKNLIHIHGSKDTLLPCKYVHADYVVKNGGHLMVMNQSDDVNRILAEILSSL